MKYFLQKYMPGKTNQEFFEYFGLDAINWVSPYKPGKGEYYKKLQSRNGTFEFICSSQWEIECQDIDGQDYPTTRFTFYTPKGSLVTVLKFNEYTCWISEHLIKNKNNIELIA